MRYDTVIIGGGLAALVCGIELARGGKKAAIVAKGHSALQFSSASFGLYNGKNPIEAIESLAESHPYKKLGGELVEQLAVRGAEILNVAGVAASGVADANHYVLTPVGTLRQCWLSLDGVVRTDSDKKFDFDRAAIFTPEGFLDFYTQFVADGLNSAGVATTIHTFTLPELAIRRNNPTEMRSVGVARALDKEENILALASIISHTATDCDTIVMPAVLGFNRSDVQNRLESITGKRVVTVPTLPPSVEGIKVERTLRRVFEQMGGVIFTGHTVVSHAKEEELIASVTTDKGVTLVADEFVLSTGSFIGGGLTSDRKSISEPIFGADVDSVEGAMTTINIFEPQPFMSCGVVTNDKLQVVVAGKSVDNLYACGAILSGFNPVKEGCGAGVAMTTAIAAADNILNR